MRFYMIVRETIAREREIEVLHSTNDSSEAILKLIAFSDEWEESILSGRCRVLMSTFVE